MSSSQRFNHLPARPLQPSPARRGQAPREAGTGTPGREAMRGYGRDYHHRNWVERAEDRVRGWFGGGPQYDRDYPETRPRSDRNHSMNAGGIWSHGPDRGYDRGYRTNNWNNQRASWDTVSRAGGYYGADFEDRPARYHAERGR